MSQNPVKTQIRVLDGTRVSCATRVTRRSEGLWTKLNRASLRWIDSWSMLNDVNLVTSQTFAVTELPTGLTSTVAQWQPSGLCLERIAKLSKYGKIKYARLRMARLERDRIRRWSSSETGSSWKSLKALKWIQMEELKILRFEGWKRELCFSKRQSIKSLDVACRVYLSNRPANGPYEVPAQ